MSTAPPNPADEPAGAVAGNKPMPLDAGIAFRLGRLTRTWRAQWAEELAALELTPPQAAVLRGVANDPGCSLRGLARLLGADPMHAKRCADDLESRSLLRSAHRAADRRSRTLGLTPAGEALAARVDELARAREVRLATTLGPADRSRLHAIVTALETATGIGNNEEHAGTATSHSDKEVRL